MAWFAATMRRALLLGLLAWGLPSAAVMDRAVFVGLSASVLRVEAPRVGGGYALGSAVVVGDGTVVTNCHVTQDALEIFIVRGGARWVVQGQASDVEHDLCLLRVPGLQATTVVLGEAARLTVGQTVTALGFTGGMGMQNSTGEVVALHRFDDSRVIQSNNWFSSGASGGGLFDDHGRLVGILTFRLRGGEADYFAAPVDWVRRMLAARPSFANVAPLDRRQRPFWQADAVAQPRFLQAARLLREARFGELEAVAVEWLRVDPADAEPWGLLGTALERQGRWSEARRAFECSLTLEPARATAQARLAAVSRPGPAAVASAAALDC